jgi:microcystin-dependent protein
MSNQFLGEIRLFAGDFAPKGWAFCNGQIIPVQTATALFSLLGTTYGGDGRTNFGLPDFRDRVPVNQGQGNNLSPYDMGQRAGDSQVLLQQNQLPIHTHPTGVSATTASVATPGAAVSLGVCTSDIYGAATDLAGMTTQAVGSNLPHTNLQPYLGLSFIIATVGVYPARN